MLASKLTVVQLLPELEEGGVEGETVDLAIYLARNGHKSIVISSGGRLVRQLEEAGCIHVRWDYIGEKSLRCLQYILKLKKFLIDEQVDILHLRSRLPAWIGYLSWKLIPEDQRPSLLTTFHGFYSVNSYSCIMTKGQTVAAVSETIREHIQQNYKVDPRKIKLIHGGFDTEEFSVASVDSFRIEKLRCKWLDQQDGKPVIVLPGRLTLWKGQDILIDALARLSKHDFVCLLIGDTEENPSFTKKLRERIRSHGLQDKILLVGHCSDMPAALLLADIVVSASSTQPEAFGKVAIEAMAMEKPVIATSHGGSLETVIDGETGWLIPPLNAVALADAIVEAIESPGKCKAFGQKGRSHVLTHFTAKRMCEKTVALYTELHLQRNDIEHKTLSVMQLLPELNSGGVERGTLELARYLVQKKHNSIVVSGGGRLVEQLESEGSLHVKKSIGSKTPLALAHIWPMRRLMRKHNIDILHLRSRMPAWVGYIAWLSISKKKRPLLVTTFHGFYSVNAYSGIMTKGEGVIAVSESIKKHIKDNYNRSKDVRLVFRGVEIDSFSPAMVSYERVEKLRRDWGVRHGKPVIMLPGRLTRLKGQEVFLKSLVSVKNREYIAILVGDTEDNPGYTAELRGVIESNGLQDIVKMVGHCSDMPAAFMIADIVLSTSSLEPEAFGRTTVEAMAMGCPVIVTGHGGSLETVIPEENGWIVPPSDIIELAGAIDQALATPRERLKEIGENNQRRVMENFTASAMCEQTFSFYQELLKKKVQ
ncbi:MAG: glycosyltransferase involved in cell wall biosynthesis [Desulforhopalus sp.]|jgi:glycosyltransferase involved in cell wall biosynthesis